MQASSALGRKHKAEKHTTEQVVSLYSFDCGAALGHSLAPGGWNSEEERYVILDADPGWPKLLPLKMWPQSEGDWKNLSVTDPGLKEYTDHIADATYSKRNLTHRRQCKTSGLNLINLIKCEKEKEK